VERQLFQKRKDVVKGDQPKRKMKKNVRKKREKVELVVRKEIRN
jgi:hypothetical protein